MKKLFLFYICLASCSFANAGLLGISPNLGQGFTLAFDDPNRNGGEICVSLIFTESNSTGFLITQLTSRPDGSASSSKPMECNDPRKLFSDLITAALNAPDILKSEKLKLKQLLSIDAKCSSLISIFSTNQQIEAIALSVRTATNVTHKKKVSEDGDIHEFRLRLRSEIVDYVKFLIRDNSVYLNVGMLGNVEWKLMDHEQLWIYNDLLKLTTSK